LAGHDESFKYRFRPSFLEHKRKEVEQKAKAEKERLSRKGTKHFIRPKDLLHYIEVTDTENPYRRTKPIIFYEQAVRELAHTVVAMSKEVRKLNEEIRKLKRSGEQDLVARRERVRSREGQGAEDCKPGDSDVGTEAGERGPEEEAGIKPQGHRNPRRAKSTAPVVVPRYEALECALPGERRGELSVRVSAGRAALHELDPEGDRRAPYVGYMGPPVKITRAAADPDDAERGEVVDQLLPKRE
jgi:hypothetical protein